MGTGSNIKPWPRRVTDESIVLLKNAGELLPIDAGKVKSIAVIGPLADRVALDWYSGMPPFAITPLEGIRARAVNRRNGPRRPDGADLTDAAALAAKADIAAVIIGNHPTCHAGWFKCPMPSDGKEAIDRKSLTLEQESLAKAVYTGQSEDCIILQTQLSVKRPRWTRREYTRQFCR